MDGTLDSGRPTQPGGDGNPNSGRPTLPGGDGNPNSGRPTLPGGDGNPNSGRPNQPGSDGGRPNQPPQGGDSGEIPQKDNTKDKIKYHEGKIDKETRDVEENKKRLEFRKRFRDNNFKQRVMNARQDSLVDKRKGTTPKQRWRGASSKTRATRALGATSRGVGRGIGRSVGSGMGKSLGGGVARSAASAALSGGGAAGVGAAGAGVLGAAGAGLAAIAGPLSVAVALAPLIKDLAADSDRRMNEDMDEAIAEREKISAEVSELLESVKSFTDNTEGNLEGAQQKAQALLDRVRNPAALALSKHQGLALQKQLNEFETKFSPTSMPSLVPFTSNEELVAGTYF